MGKITATCIVLVALAAMAQAQLPSANIFFGYSYLHATTPTPASLPDQSGVLSSGSTGLNGWNASVEGKLLPLLGVVADVSANYGSPTVTDECGFVAGCVPIQDRMNSDLYNFLLGPQISFSVGRVRPFAHALFGAGHLSENTKTRPFSFSDTAFAYALGGGIDYRLAGPLGWRVQGDVLQDRFFGQSQDNFRFSTGVVLHF